MAENLYIEKHKYSNPKWREGWDRVFQRSKVRELFEEHDRLIINEQRKNTIRNIFLGK